MHDIKNLEASYQLFVRKKTKNNAETQKKKVLRLELSVYELFFVFFQNS